MNRLDHYTPPPLLFNGHLETIYPSLFRQVMVPYQRERIGTPDDDFLDLDWLKQSSKKLILISHGLEGNSTRSYVTGMARCFFKEGYDILAWNYRGCSDEMNKQIRFYHSGATDDLATVIQHALTGNSYEEINLIGFSLGGNLTLKYAGEQASHLPPVIKKVVAFSVPLDLHASCIQISQSSNWIYAQRFIKSLKKKVVGKSKRMTGINIDGIEKINALLEFDDRYTAPLHGYKNAVDYYQKCSSLYYLDRITLPTLIVNALNDPFLSTSCYPVDQLKDHSFVQLETPKRGGHCGFALFNQNGVYWSEQRALDFIQA
jgi:predicted alpha/beta-fold hydrolase